MTHVKLRIVQLRRNFPNLRDFCTSTLLLSAISPLTRTRSSVIFQTFAQLKLSPTSIFSGRLHRKVMALTIVTLQFHYGGCFVSDPTLSTNVDVSSSPQQDNADVSSSPHKNRADLSSSPQIDRADVSLSQPFDENENRNLNQNQSPLVEEQSPLVEEQALAPRVEEHSDSDSLYDVDENIDDLIKEETDRVNLDEIPSGPVGIDAGFEDIYKERRGRFEGNLGGDDPYFDSSDSGSDISEDEGDHIENDEVVHPSPRKKTTKIYFDPTAKKKNAATGTSVATARTNVATSNVAARTSVTSAAIAGTSPSASCIPSASGGRPTSATSIGQKRKTSTALRGGATLAYKKPRPKKAKTAGYGLLVGSGGSVTERSGNTDRVLHSATLSSSTPTNIDLGYKPNGLRWKGTPAISQRQLREESYRSTQGTH
ncbi:hypothetical protein KY289_035748 [Solanum tuberosum]|nr:hypothetical protein KY289_035748 [Solanum tuberosum]